MKVEDVWVTNNKDLNTTRLFVFKLVASYNCGETMLQFCGLFGVIMRQGWV